MTQYAKVALLIIAILSIPMGASGREKGSAPEDSKRATVFALRGDHATVSFGTDKAVSIQLRGRLFDASTNRPLRGTAIEVVRFEIEGVAGIAQVSMEDIAVLPHSAKAVLEKTTADEGDFILSDLAPGRYSLQVAWDEVPAGSDLVGWDLQWVEKPASARGER